MLQGASQQSSLPVTLYRGLEWDVKKGQWQVCIQVNGHKRILGHFVKQSEAAWAYDAALLVTGSTARPNHLDEVGDDVKSAVSCPLLASLNQ